MCASYTMNSMCTKVFAFDVSLLNLRMKLYNYKKDKMKLHSNLDNLCIHNLDIIL